MTIVIRSSCIAYAHLGRLALDMEKPCVTTAEIKAAVLSALADAGVTKRATTGYLSPVEAAAYMNISPRRFDDEPAKELPCYRLVEKGKRLYKQSDLDAWMDRKKCAPIERNNIDAIVDSIF